MSGFSMTRRIAIAVLSAGLALAATGVAAKSISGNYSADGRNPDGSTYTGKVQITEMGSAVGVAWQVGSQGYTGSGRREGRVLTVDWGDQHPVIYVIMPNGELHGTWANGRALEKLVPW